MKKRFFNLRARFDGNVFSRAEYDDPEFLHLMDMMDQLLQRQGIKNLLNFFPVLRKLPQGKKVGRNRRMLQTPPPPPPTTTT